MLNIIKVTVMMLRDYLSADMMLLIWLIKRIPFFNNKLINSRSQGSEGTYSCSCTSK